MEVLPREGQHCGYSLPGAVYGARTVASKDSLSCAMVGHVVTWPEKEVSGSYDILHKTREKEYFSI